MKETMKTESTMFRSFEMVFDSEKDAKKLGRKLARASIAMLNSLEKFDKISDKDLWGRRNYIEFREQLPGFHVSLNENNRGKIVLNFCAYEGAVWDIRERRWEPIVDSVLGEGYSKKYKTERLQKTLDELRK